MNIILAKSAGFCFGVRRAVDLAEEYAGKDNVCTLGDIIHNKQVVSELESKGVVSLSLEEILKLPPQTVIIRSHGVGKEVVSALEDAGHNIVDGTCPFVKKIHEKVREYSKKGYHIIVIGDSNHDEVKGIVGWVKGSDVSIIETPEDAKKFSLNTIKPICLVSQTTFNKNKFKECVEIINQKEYDIITLDTICEATYMRQKEAEEIAAKVDAMIVIGDINSSNSRKLFDVTKGKCKTYFLQTKADLDPTVLHSIDNLGITAGASTPDILIREVMKNVRNEF